MIKHLRIDNRLIHGQVAAAWKAYIEAESIIVCNDAVAIDRIQKLTLPLAARGSTVHVFSIAETVTYEKAHPDEILFVICKYASDALALLESGVKVQELNVGNQAPEPGKDYVMVTNMIAATAKDAEVYRKLAQLHGGKLNSQLVPTYAAQDFLELLGKSGL